MGLSEFVSQRKNIYGIMQCFCFIQGIKNLYTGTQIAGPPSSPNVTTSQCSPGTVSIHLAGVLSEKGHPGVIYSIPVGETHTIGQKYMSVEIL